MTSHYNSPGLTTLAYRVSTHGTSFQRMLAGLRTETASPNDSDQGDRPLATLNTSHRDDPAIAFLDSLATVVDVLSFYQERIANEGYLNTATERLSVLELTRTIGYELNPGVAASTFLAFTVDDTPGTTSVATVPKGTKVQSVPGQGELPQTFETIEQIEARAQWNALTPYRPLVTQTQSISSNTTELFLEGINTQLQPGNLLILIDPSAAASNQGHFLTLQTVEPNTQDGYTKVTWSPASDQPSIESPQVFAFRQQINLFGSNAPDWKELPDDTKRKYSAIAGGIFYSTDRGNNWNSVSTGLLKNADIRALATWQDVVFAGTHKGIFYSTDGGQEWIPINQGLTNTDIHALTINAQGHLFAGATGGNVFRSTDGGESWGTIGTGSLTIVEHHIPATAEGSESWTPVNTSLPNTVVRSLFTYSSYYSSSSESSFSEQTILAGTEDGVFRSRDGGKSWIPVNTGLPNTDTNTGLTSTVVYSLITAVINNVDYLFAGTDQGVFRSTNNGDSWEVVNTNLPTLTITTGETRTEVINTVVYSLVTYERDGTTYLFAGTNQGVFRSSDNGNNWQAVNTGLPTKTVGEIEVIDIVIYSLVADTSNNPHYLLAGTNRGVFRYEEPQIPENNWMLINSGFTSNDIRCIISYQNNTILAGSKFTGLVATEWPGFTIQNNHIDLDATYSNILVRSWIVLMHSSRKQLYNINQVTTVARDDFLQSGKITRLELDSNQHLADFGSERFRETVVFAQSEQLALFEPAIQENLPLEGDQIELEQLIEGLETGKTLVVSGKKDLSQVTQTTTVDEQTINEVVVIKSISSSISSNQQRSTLTLTQSLQNRYDRTTVTINANVAQATHGETVVDEVLGSGDGTLGNQKFVLQKPPLTYISAATSSGSETTLEVRVNNILWEEVRSLYGLDDRRQAYIVRIDDNGNTNITFGDGQSGARLPTGDENITATYRSGIGLDGEVGAGSLTVLQTRPLGIVEVSNPLAAIGAASPETRDQARSQAPVNILPMERIVSVQDFETFTRSFAGIGKAKVATLEIGQNLPLIHLTIADRNGNQVSPDSILYTNLVNGINAARDPSQQRRLAVASKVEIDSYEALYFNLQAGIWVDSRYRSDLVLSEVNTLLVSAFAFEQRTFGQGVTAAEVTALIQAVDGVEAVNLEALYLTGTTQELKSSLEARLAIWNSETKQALPAQLLLLNSQTDGVSLHLV